MKSVKSVLLFLKQHGQLPLASMAVMPPPPYTHTHTTRDCSLNCEPIIPSGFLRVLYPSDRKPCYITKPCRERQLRVSGFLDFCLSFCFSAQKNVNSYWFCLSQQIPKSGFFSFCLVRSQFPLPGLKHPPYTKSASVLAWRSWKRKLRTRSMCCVR